MLLFSGPPPSISLPPPLSFSLSHTHTHTTYVVCEWEGRFRQWCYGWRRGKPWVQNHLNWSLTQLLDLRAHSPGPMLLSSTFFSSIGKSDSWAASQSRKGREGFFRGWIHQEWFLNQKTTQTTPIPTRKPAHKGLGRKASSSALLDHLCAFSQTPIINLNWTDAFLWKCIKILLGTAFALVVINPYLQSPFTSS